MNKKTPKTTEPKQATSAVAAATEANHNNSSDSSGLNITVNDTQNGTMHSPTTAGAANGKNKNNQVSTPNQASNQQYSKNLTNIDLSIVKQEALDMSGTEDVSNVHLKNVNLNSNGEINSQNNYSLNSSFKNKTNGKQILDLVTQGNVKRGRSNLLF